MFFQVVSVSLPYCGYVFTQCVESLYVGCAERDESSEEWLMKNFGAFKAMARMKDFSTLNMVFSGVSWLGFSKEGRWLSRTQ